MARIPENKIQEVLTKANIIEEVSKYTNLHKQGRNYVGLCLFHPDQSPSMIVSPDKKIFKCFSCGVGGNVIQFVEKMNNLSFPEAVLRLAKEYHVDLGNIADYVPKDPYSTEQKLTFKMNEDAAKYYQAILYNKAGLIAREYLEHRKIDREQISSWQIGFAYENNLTNHLLSLDYKNEEILNAGLATFNAENQQFYDYFRNRIVFPIKNKDGFIIGFSGRVLTDEKPKYLNTRETKVFKKSEVMFNIDYVLKNRERFEYFILLEGFMDVISLSKIGYVNSLALMGTNLSSFHINILKQLKKPIKLFLDGDEPGIKAMYKIAKLFIDNQLDFSIVDNSTKLDPDELVDQNKIDELKAMISNSVNAYEFFIEKFMQNQTINVDKKTTIINQIFSLLNYEKNPIVIDSVFDQLSNKLNISKEILINSFKPKRTKIAVENSNQERLTVMAKQSSGGYAHQNNYGRQVNTTREEDMKLRIFISLLQSDDYLQEIQDNLIYLAGNDNYSYYFQQLCSVLINYYNENKYQGNDLEQFFTLLSVEPARLLSASVNELKAALVRPKAKENFKMKLSQKELDDIVQQAKIDQLTKDIENSNNELKKIELQLEKQTCEPDRVRLLHSEKFKKQKETLILMNQRKELIDARTTKK